MLNAFFLLLILAGLCYGLARWCRVPAGITPAAAVGLIVGVLFLADFAALLRQASLLLTGLGIAGGIHGFSAVWRVRGDGMRRGGRQQAGLLWGSVVVLFFVLYAINRKQMFHEWDEFSHWGSVIRTLVEANTFHFAPNPLYFQDYPPGTALFTYFVLGVLGYSEGGAYFSYALILLAHCVPLWDLARRRGPIALTLTIAASLVLVRLLGHGWASVLIDHILSVCFVGLLTAYLVIREEKGTRWPLAMLFISLVLAKHAGTSLALVACAAMVIDAFVIAATSPRPSGQGWLRRSLSSAGASGSWVLLPLPALALSALWNHYVEVAELARGYGRFSVVDLFRRGLGCCNSERERTILARYMDHWLGLPDTLSLSLPVPGVQDILAGYMNSRLGHLTEISGYSPLLLTLGLSGIGLVAIFRSPVGVARLRQEMALVLLGGASLLFSTVQLLFYLYAFSEYEALAIASFKRFQNTYYLAWALSALAWLSLAKRKTHSLDDDIPRRSYWHSMILLGSVILMLVAGVLALNVSRIDDAKRAERYAIRDWVSTLPLPPGNGGRVYIVWQGSNGFEFWETYHEILPRVTNRDCYSLGPPHFANDIWSCPYDENRLRAELGSYDFLLVARGYADLQRNYPDLVPDLGPTANRELLQIDRAGDALHLHRLPPK